MVERFVDHLASVGKSRRLDFDNHTEASQHRRIDVADRIGSPKRHDGIFLQQSIDFTLVGAPAEKESSHVVEDVFGLVEHEQLITVSRKHRACDLPEHDARDPLASELLPFGELHFVGG